MLICIRPLTAVVQSCTRTTVPCYHTCTQDLSTSLRPRATNAAAAAAANCVISLPQICAWASQYSAYVLHTVASTVSSSCIRPDSIQCIYCCRHTEQGSSILACQAGNLCPQFSSRPTPGIPMDPQQGVLNSMQPGATAAMLLLQVCVMVLVPVCPLSHMGAQHESACL